MGFGIITPTTTSGIDMTLAFQQSLSLCGLVQTGDTGQWDGVSAPTVNDYLIYRFNDALSTTYPIYLKFMNYTIGSNVLNPNLTMLQSIGFATDGAGTITAPRSTFTRSSSNGDSYVFQRILYSYSNSGFYIALDTGSNASPAFCVERALNQDGTIADSQGEIGCFNNYTKNNSIPAKSVTLKPNGFKDDRVPYYPILGNNTYVTNTGLSTVMPYYFFGESRPWQSNLMSVGNKLANIGWNCITNGTSKYYQQQATTHGSYVLDYNFGIGHLPGMLWE